MEEIFFGPRFLHRRRRQRDSRLLYGGRAFVDRRRVTEFLLSYSCASSSSPPPCNQTQKAPRVRVSLSHSTPPHTARQPSVVRVPRTFVIRVCAINLFTVNLRFIVSVRRFFLRHVLKIPVRFPFHFTSDTTCRHRMPSSPQQVRPVIGYRERVRRLTIIFSFSRSTAATFATVVDL